MKAPPCDDFPDRTQRPRLHAATVREPAPVSFYSPLPLVSTVKLYVDTADTDRIRECVNLGVIDGVTTNPAIVANGDRSYREVVSAVDDLIDGPVFVQVIADDVEGMVREARTYQSWATDVVAKIPATRSGYEALDRLRGDGIPAGITVVFSVEQAVLAAKNDAAFVAPYVGRLTDAGVDGVEIVRRIQRIYDTYGFDTDVLAASIRTTRQATDLYDAGVDAITMSPDLLDAHVSTPETADSLAGFESVWDEQDATKTDRGNQ